MNKVLYILSWVGSFLLLSIGVFQESNTILLTSIVCFYSIGRYDGIQEATKAIADKIEEVSEIESNAIKDYKQSHTT